MIRYHEGKIRVSERQAQHDPGDRPVGDRAVRLGLRHRTFFPTANPPATKIENGKQVAAAAAAAPIPAADAPRARSATARSCSPRRRASRSRRRAARLDQPARRADRRSRAHHQRETIAAEFAAGPPVLAGRRAERLFRRLRLDRARASRCPGRDTRLDGERHRPDPGDAGHAELGQWPAARSSRSSSRSTTTICSPPSRGVINRGAAPVAVRPYRAGQPRRPVARSRQLDHPCRPDRRVQRRRQLRQRLQRRRRGGRRSASPAPAAGSASPTNIGWPR